MKEISNPKIEMVRALVIIVLAIIMLIIEWM